ncbi:ABC transporter ATP-binding protein [Reyranella sp. CPCC 100927]|uniref:ABC transporter ATP-binding protein n=1 Tax=Reyranella sp. CPCC 100927 TaxID=2599616 RepID=UPI0011B58F06|nr:ABC transporter ATP-binding protein [Reyranella sp. CPCC 100927]TWS98486.1 ABC transporter ATP-binding protein [Reyranella sp. CPCC 100927]
MLSIDAIDTFYGQSQALHGVSFDVAQGEILALLGRNGAGKTTTLRAIMGLNRVARGAVRFDGRVISGLPAHKVARIGVTLVPETRDAFSLLSVEENIQLGYRKGSPYTLERLLEMFPIIREFRSKKGGELSGGQQQLMVMARGLAMGPRLLLLDEPSQGLAPIMVNAVADVLSALKRERLTVILVEQNLRMALDVADRVVILEDGVAVDSLTQAAALADPGRVEKHLVVH